MTKIWDELIKLALNSDLIRHSRHSAAIVYKGKIIATGTARYKTHPLVKKYQTNVERVYLHAEMDVIIKVMNKFGVEFLQECDLYVVRTTKAGKVSCSKPCDGCTKAIDAFGIRNIYWSTENGFCEQEDKRFNSR